MTTIEKSIEIPVDRRLRLDLTLPDELPPGRAELRLTINPSPASGGMPFDGLFGSLKDSGLFSGDSVDIQRKMRDEW